MSYLVPFCSCVFLLPFFEQLDLIGIFIGQTDRQTDFFKFVEREFFFTVQCPGKELIEGKRPEKNRETNSERE